ncbi:MULTISPECIES: relaxase/mobilization nuclease RlxS [unclassified Mesorhizobium]|uniref:relaxase/mobilization nuclease RlxS n=1 Tax=unclassified Mesorhizobium TaxID=325217 RepID=UPI0019282583|nr:MULTISPECIES: relaxase/mobilization nuclease RlxS [unclassified Mesorhizobium]BCG97254.1 conjugal transfer protein TraI [Mesorhizobium sp. 131-2-1]BCH04324.1 conjugal transfer protein TraI [Mesorhizobium sp. 131-2-5]
MQDDEFRPKLGKIGSRGSKAGKRYAGQVKAAINRAGGRLQRGGRFTGSRTGRGGAAAALLKSRDRYAAFRQRRVMVKARIVKLAGKGADGARAHLRYIQRDGVTREGEPGKLYGPGRDRIDSKAFVDRADSDRHQFRFIVAPEDSIEYDDLKPLTRRLMAQMEEDLGTRLDWVAVDHFNTGHPHTHIIVRGKDDRGENLVIAREYISSGIRERAAEVVSLDLGPRTDREIEQRLRQEMEQERFTSIDRQLLRMRDEDRLVSTDGRDAFRQALHQGRLRKLERMGLAEEVDPVRWRLDDELEATLRRTGERGDIIKTMHRELTGKGLARSAAGYLVHDRREEPSTPVVGRLVARGLADEINDRHYLIVDGVDGKSHWIDIGKGELTEPTPDGCIVRVTSRDTKPRQVDRTIADIATAHGGRYSVDMHLKHDAFATESFAETHIRRLEAIRRSTGGVEREPNGTWIIAPDHLDRVAEYERLRARVEPVIVEKLSSMPLERQVSFEGATWLDRNLVAERPEPLRNSGFGHEVREAHARRRQWLIAQGLAHEEQDRVVYRANMISILRQRELNRVAGQLSDQLGLSYAEAQPGERIEGTLRRSVELASGKYAVIEKSREFTLVPWRPVLDRYIGKEVSGVARGEAISWTLGRQRSGHGVS